MSNVPQTKHRPANGSLQVNSTDYDGDIVIEMFSYWGINSGPSWAVPAWDECGEAAFSGPFSSHEEAQLALDKARGQ